MLVQKCYWSTAVDDLISSQAVYLDAAIIDQTANLKMTNLIIGYGAREITFTVSNTADPDCRVLLTGSFFGRPRQEEVIFNNNGVFRSTLLYSRIDSIKIIRSAFTMRVGIGNRGVTPPFTRSQTAGTEIVVETSTTGEAASQKFTLVEFLDLNSFCVGSEAIADNGGVLENNFAGSSRNYKKLNMMSPYCSFMFQADNAVPVKLQIFQGRNYY